MNVAIPKNGLPNREALRRFLGEQECQCSLNSAYEAEQAGKKLVFLYYDQEAYGDRTYYYCEEDDTVYSNYFSIGD